MIGNTKRETDFEWKGKQVFCVLSCQVRLYIKHPNGDINEAVGCTGLETYAQAGCRDVNVCDMQIIISSHVPE